ncbi:MAG: sugar transferase [Bacteroidaceae bacterium]|jgi:putative colanic acid biosynthesis UDP-glucose lipid carrier transferase|nr:sugar transferase [Bacteroidaceae bacterium]
MSGSIVTNNVLKRIFDVIIASLALCITVVLFPFIAIAIKVQSRGPIFFKQKRSGLENKTFVMYKFRSMHLNDEADTRQATSDDERIFPFGKFLRKTRFDELPQFWNVLTGDMSVIGPRPHMLAHTDMYSKLIGNYMDRLAVRPGITGLAQVMGRCGETTDVRQMKERVKLDIFYINHWSIGLDCRILLLTFKTVLLPEKNTY